MRQAGPAATGDRHHHDVPRYLGHALVLALVLAVAGVGNMGHSITDWRSLALDRTVDLPSAFAHPDSSAQDDALLRPPSPTTQLVNRPRQGILLHKVQEGDTTTSIADRFEITLQTVLWANGLNEGSVLVPGQELKVLPVSGVLHTVRAGERLSDIAARYQSDEQAIIDFNQITDATQIASNDVLVVPGGRVEERPRPLPSARTELRPMPDDLVADEQAANAAQAKPLQATSYAVASGDNLSTIAAKFGVSVETLMWANGLQDNPERIAEGQTLTIIPVSGAFHTIADGDTLSEIAADYGVDPAQIIAANGLASADALSVGQKLIVPGAKLATASEVAARARARAAQAAAATGLKYLVAPGDSLNSIAYRYDVEPSAIVRANGLTTADFLSVGQQLVIPGVRAAAAKPPGAPQPAAPAAPAPAPPPSGEGNRIVNVASQYLGYRYAWGGHTPAGFDCSGYTWYVFGQVGITIPQHDLWGQLQSGPRINQANLQPGDLVFFQNTYQRGLSHVGIYIGGGRFISAEDYGKGVRVASMYDSYWGPRYYGASRP